MELWGFTAWEWFVLVQHELLLFAGIFFLLGALDEFAVDIAYIWLRLTGRVSTEHLSEEEERREELTGQVAVFIPAWREATVIGETLRHMAASWPQEDLRIYLGCYRNDPATLVAAIDAAVGDDRLRIVVHDIAGPSTKADCLNRLFRALEVDEGRQGFEARMVVLHDAEDMVDRAALPVLDRAIEAADMVQLPVRPEPQNDSRWIGSHYCEEFTEAHAKGLVVRDALGAGVPLAGVGCALRRGALAGLARIRGDNGPFAADCLTEDYELGLGICQIGGRSRFLRLRGHDGRLIATRAFFPARIDQAVRQKTRWLHGIALQGWDRLGWSWSPVEFWMRLRDRRGPMMALVLFVAYSLLLVSTGSWLLGLTGLGGAVEFSPLLETILVLNFASLLWRCVSRFFFTAREYGVGEGFFAILRIPVTNIIAIMAGRRALIAYMHSLRTGRVRWDKTEHHAHPASARLAEAGA